MLFSALGYLTRPVLKGAWWVTKQAGRGAWRATREVVVPSVAATTAWAAPHVARGTVTAAKDVIRATPAIAKGTAGAVGGAWHLLTTPDELGRNIENVFTGRRLRKPVVLGLELFGLYQAMDEAPRVLIQQNAVAQSLPMLTRSGNFSMQGPDYTYDPLLGARGG